MEVRSEHWKCNKDQWNENYQTSVPQQIEDNGDSPNATITFSDVLQCSPTYSFVSQSHSNSLWTNLLSCEDNGNVLTTASSRTYRAHGDSFANEVIVIHMATSEQFRTNTGGCNPYYYCKTEHACCSSISKKMSILPNRSKQCRPSCFATAMHYLDYFLVL